MEDKLVTGIYTGRPFGGTAVLMRKHFAAQVSRVVTNSAISRAAVCRVQGRHHCPPGVVWAHSQLPGVGLLPRHQHPPNKTALG